MTSGQRDVRRRLRDILESAERIRAAESLGENADDDGDEVAAQVALDAVLYNIVVIGEAVRTLPAAVQARAGQVPWRDIVDMRNYLTHEYFRVLVPVVRATIDEPLDHLTIARAQLLEDLDD